MVIAIFMLVSSAEFFGQAAVWPSFAKASSKYSKGVRGEGTPHGLSHAGSPPVNDEQVTRHDPQARAAPNSR